jgi:hypothetical protein
MKTNVCCVEKEEGGKQETFTLAAHLASLLKDSNPSLGNVNVLCSLLSSKKK